MRTRGNCIFLISKFLTSKNLVYKFLLIIVSLIPLNAHACIFPPSAAEAVHEHDLVFTGKMNGCFTNENENFIEFSLNKIWKGDNHKIYKAHYTCVDKSFFQKGRHYLIYANYSENSEYIKISSGVGNCSRTTEIKSFEQLLLQKILALFGIPPRNYQVEDFNYLEKFENDSYNGDD